MPTDPYVILGVEKGCTQNEIEEAYKAKRAALQEHMFEEGEAGAEAARQIGILDEAYNSVMEEYHESATVSGEGESSLAAVKEAIANQDYEGAQRELDKMSYRGAEWHYCQSFIFYKKNWLNDSKKQLEIAMQMDPENARYSAAMERLMHEINGAQPFDREGSGGVYGPDPSAARTERTYSSAQADTTGACCEACQALWCADCCCECMGGDLIRCC